ncbi:MULTISPECIES: hypothetical protein [unclassified Rhizobium]|uniref:hypothetical protein n=1 Tax=unclassified Rhizobium TaxID=2613769 RepID=UPI0007EC03FD|nr:MULTISPECIES: hypothetical protein [unclassified Rhizobium]
MKSDHRGEHGNSKAGASNILRCRRFARLFLSKISVNFLLIAFLQLMQDFMQDDCTGALPQKAALNGRLQIADEVCQLSRERPSARQ